MIQSISDRGFLGLLSPAQSKFPEELAHLALQDAPISQVIHLPDSKGIIAAWGVGTGAEIVSDGDLIAITLGAAPPAEKSGANSPSTESLASRLCATYRQRRELLPSDIHGDFALALIDAANDKLILAIDRLGVRPLYYATSPGRWTLFSTDLDRLRSLPAFDGSLNAQAIFDYTYFHAVPSPLTIFKGVKKLPPAHRLTVDEHGERLERYWLPSFTERDEHDAATLSTELLHRLRTAVERASTGTGTGAFLSGGLDSSTVAGLLAETLAEPAPAISVGFDVEGYDETEYARIAARHFGLKHHTHYMTADEIAESVPIIAAGYPEPFGNSSVIPAYICAVAAREQGIQTLLAGDGGDELFAGNTRYAKQTMFEYYFRIPSLLRRVMFEPLFGSGERAWQLGPLRKLRRYIEQARVPLPGRLQTFNLLEMRGSESFFTETFLSSVDTSHPRQLLEAEFHAPVEGDALDRMLFLDWRFTLADNDLRKVTRTCELAGVGVEFPFLDDDVVEFSTRVPSNLKLRRMQLRYFYKRALAGYLPPEIISKKKHGFGLPFGEWLRTDQRLQQMVYDALTDLGRRDIFRADFIGALIDDHREGHAAFYGNMVWVLAMLEWWLAAHRIR